MPNIVCVPGGFDHSYDERPNNDLLKNTLLPIVQRLFIHKELMVQWYLHLIYSLHRTLYPLFKKLTIGAGDIFNVGIFLLLQQNIAKISLCNVQQHEWEAILQQ